MPKNEEKTEKTHDILEDLRGAEKAVKAQLLVKQLSVLKGLARDIFEAKEQSVMILEEIGVNKEDVKRIVDFVNSMPSVQLTENDFKDLREKVKSNLSSDRKKVEQKVEESMEKYILKNNQLSSLTGLSGGINYWSGPNAVNTNAVNAIYTTSAGNTVIHDGSSVVELSL